MTNVAALIALVAAVGTLSGGLAAYLGSRATKRKIQPEVEALRDQAAEAITQAAKNAVDVVERALERAEQQLRDSDTKLTTVLESLAGLEVALTEAQHQLTTAIADRDSERTLRKAAEKRVAELTDVVERLRARVVAIEEAR